MKKIAPTMISIPKVKGRNALSKFIYDMEEDDGIVEGAEKSLNELVCSDDMALDVLPVLGATEVVCNSSSSDLGDVGQVSRTEGGDAGSNGSPGAALGMVNSVVAAGPIVSIDAGSGKENSVSVDTPMLDQSGVAKKTYEGLLGTSSQSGETIALDEAFYRAVGGRKKGRVPGLGSASDLYYQVTKRYE